MWRTSIPRNWRAISDRPILRVHGKNSDKRDTLEFLRETQRYIDRIRKHEDPEVKFQSLATRTVQVKTRHELTTAPLLTDREPLISPPILPLKTLSGQASRAGNRSVEVREQSPKKVERVLTLPANLVEPVYGEDAEVVEEYIVTSFVHPRLLVPAAKKRHQQRRPHPLQSASVKQFLSRFDRRQEASVALPTKRGLTGWKLTAAEKSARARTSLTSRSEGKLRKFCSTSVSHADLRGFPVSSDTN